MTDERDPEFTEPVSQRISQSYREMGAEEPPRALDDAILAAARRESDAHPAALAALAARGGRQRWYAPLATAAVLVLAVTVTLHMRAERPDIESPVQQAAAPPASGPSSPAAGEQLKLKADAQLQSPARKGEKEAAIPAATGELNIARRKAAGQPAPSVAAAPALPAASEPRPFAADRAAASASARSDEPRGAVSSVTGTLARQLEERTSRDAEAAARAPQAGPIQALVKRAVRAEAPANVQAQKQEDTPERELERIAELRGQGRHDEADKALAEFRKRYPDYRIPEAMRERVERR